METGLDMGLLSCDEGFMVWGRALHMCAHLCVSVDECMSSIPHDILATQLLI